MSTDISLQTTSYQVGDRSWLLAEPDYKPNVTLDISKFSKSGTDEVQTITVTGSPTGGSFTVNGQSVAYDATTSDVQGALDTALGAGKTTVSGSGPYVVSFTNPGDAATLTVDGSGLTGGTTPSVTVTTGTAGANAHYPNGYIPSGTAIGQVTATGLFGPYDNSAGDGRQTCYGLTYGDVRAIRQDGSTASKVGTGAVVYDAVVSQSRLPFQSGTGSVDSSAKSDLAQIRWEA